MHPLSRETYSRFHHHLLQFSSLTNHNSVRIKLRRHYSSWLVNSLLKFLRNWCWMSPIGHDQKSCTPRVNGCGERGSEILISGIIMNSPLSSDLPKKRQGATRSDKKRQEVTRSVKKLLNNFLCLKMSN